MQRGMFFIGVILAVMTVGAASTFAQVTENAQVTEKPQPPPWVNKDGTVDLAKVPREVSAVGADGKLARDANGSEKKVPTYADQQPPPPLRGGENKP